MLQNLLGTPVSGLATPTIGPESRSDGLAKNLDSNLGKFDKSLILNEPKSPAVQLTAPAPVLGKELASDLSTLPQELLGSLRESLQALFDQLYPGKELPHAGNLLPNATPLDLAAVLERVVELQSALQSAQQDGADAVELDAASLADLTRQLEAVLAQLEPQLAALANTTISLPVAPVTAASPQGQGLDALAARAAIDGTGSNSAHSAALVQGATLVQLRGVLAEVRDALQQALQPGLSHAGALANNAIPHGERGASEPVAGLKLGLPNAASAAFTPATAQVLSTTPANPIAAAAQVATTVAAPSQRGGAAVQLAPNAVSNTAKHAAGSGARIDSSAPGAPTTLLPVVDVLRATALGAAGFELKPAGQTLEPLAAAMQTSAGLLQPGQPGQLAAAQAAATPQAGAHTFTTSVGLPVVNGQWGSQIAQRITWLTGQGINTADIHLNPPELGPMQVRIDSSENAARVTISVHNAMTREALEAQLPRLRDLFAEQGLELVDVDVENRDFAGEDSQSAAGDNEAADDETATPENALAAGASSELANEADSISADGDTIVLSYALVDAYA